MMEIQVQKNMTDNERIQFQSEYNSRRKDTTVAILLALFLGGIGAHRFYLGQNGWGIVYLLFCWTFIPPIIALIECFVMKGRVQRYNDEVAKEIADKIMLLRRDNQEQ